MDATHYTSREFFIASMNKRFIGLFLIITAVAGALIFQATRSSSSLVLLPSDLIKHGSASNLERIRVGGRVAANEIRYQLQPEIVLNFEIEDPKSPAGTVPVIYRGLKPDMFAAGRDVIIDGDFEQGILRAATLLTQCPSKYEPPIPGASEYEKSQYPAGAQG
jgi:cytochrome c-type biogenesis protein CcmE